MKLEKRMKSIISYALAFIILISSAPVYGEKIRFVDVPKTRWSYEHVENMAKLGYLQGKGGRIFGPTDNLTFLESMAAMSRLTRPSETEIQNAKDQYSGLMKELKVTKEWEKEALSMAIYKDIVSVNEVKNAAKQNIFHKPIQKVAASVFLAKAMGLEEKANSLPVVFIEYKDVLEIEPPFRKYLKVLLDAGVLDEKGDSTGNFNPKQPLRREILATMLSRADKYLYKDFENQANKPEEKPVLPEKPEIQTETVRGMVKRVSQEMNKKFLIIEDENNRESSFLIDDKTEIKLDGKTGTSESLVEGQEVILEVEKETRKLISIESQVREEEYQGLVRHINPISKEIELEFNQSGNINRKKFQLLDSVRVRKDGNDANLVNVLVGDYAELLVRNGRVASINAKSEILEIEGSIVEVEKNRNGRVKIYVESGRNREYDILVDRETDIQRDGKLVRPEELRETDEVSLTARYDLEEKAYIAEKIDADIVIGQVMGTVIEISNRINQNPLITVKNSRSGREETYELSSSAYIEVDGRRSNSLPENPGYDAEIYVEGGSDVTEIYIDTAGMETSMVGRIKYIDPRGSYMEVEVSSGYRDKEIIKVYIESRTTITDRNLRRLRMRDLFEDDFVNIIGVYKGANFVADTISLR